MPVISFFSSHQISAHPIRNFRANPSTPGRFDNIAYDVCRDVVGLEEAASKW